MKRYCNASDDELAMYNIETNPESDEESLKSAVTSHSQGIKPNYIQTEAKTNATPDETFQKEK